MLGSVITVLPKQMSRKKKAGVSNWVLLLLNYPGLSNMQVFGLYSCSTISLSVHKKEHNGPSVLFSFCNPFLLLRYI
jgi:hypothetical protein